jgi:hypothetical protein
VRGFGLNSASASPPDDPWWTYYKSHARNRADGADRFIRSLRTFLCAAFQYWKWPRPPPA